MKLRHSIPGIVFLIFFFISCEEEGSETNYNPNVKSSREYVFAEDIFFEIINVYFKGITDNSVLDSNYNYIDNCAITLNPSGTVMTFSYGTVNRWCPDNKYRRGSFTAQFSGGILQPGTTVTLTIDSLFVDDQEVSGSMSSEFLEPLGSGNEQLTFAINSGQVILEDTITPSVIHFDADYLLTWQEGRQTPDFHEDDMLLVTGNSQCISTDQTAFETVIQEPLEDYLDCFWIVSGTHQITVPAAQVTSGIIDYIQADECNYQVDFFFGESYFYDYLKY
jgi:hypothetical protein